MLLENTLVSRAVNAWLLLSGLSSYEEIWEEQEPGLLFLSPLEVQCDRDLQTDRIQLPNSIPVGLTSVAPCVGS